MSSPTAASDPSRAWARVGILSAGAILLVGVVVLSTLAAHDRSEQLDHAALDLGQLAHDRTEVMRLYLARRQREVDGIGQMAEPLLAGDAPAPRAAALARAMEMYFSIQPYETLDLLDAEGAVRLHLGVGTDVQLLAAAMSAAPGVQFVRDATGRWTVMAVAAAGPLGRVLLTGDGDRMLGTVLRRDTNARPLADTALVRVDGETVTLIEPRQGVALPPALLAALARTAPWNPVAAAELSADDGTMWSAVAYQITGPQLVLVDARRPDAALGDWQRRAQRNLLLGGGGVVLLAAYIGFLSGRRARRAVADAVARDRAEQQRERRFRLMIEHGSDLIVIFGADGALQYVSPSCRRGLGYGPEELVGRQVLDLVDPRDVAAVRAEIDALVATPGGSRRARLRLLHRDGSARDIEVVCDNALDDPGIGGLVVTGRDVTDQVATQRTLEASNVELEQRIARATAELRAANRALADVARTKDEFLASVSHELRTPLHAVLGIAEALQEGVYGALIGRQAEALGTVEASGRDLLALINDVLDVAKVEAGRLELDVQPVELEALCQSSLRLVREAAAKKHLALTLELDPRVKQIHCDARRLKQVLVNLLSNAVKFTPEGGRISLSSAAEPDLQRVQLTVRDSGIGIAEDKMSLLFQPFRQLDAGLAREYAGTGLGLALVRRLVELHGGSVAAESREGEGSRFTVSLPLAAATRPTRHAPAPPAPLALLVDDSQAALAALADTLRGGGYEVDTQREGAEAIVAARARRPAVIVLGSRLPDLEPLVVAQRLRQDPDLATVPVVVLAALVLPGERERYLRAGVDRYLAKPIPAALLLDELAALLHDRAA